MLVSCESIYYAIVYSVCLILDEFNNKLLTPDLSKQQLENLHNEATKLYKEYFLSETPNFIGCSQEIVDNYKEMLTAGVYSVAKFRTSEPLYQAYEYALNILENELLPSFFLSNEVTLFMFIHIHCSLSNYYFSVLQSYLWIKTNCFIFKNKCK